MGSNKRTYRDPSKTGGRNEICRENVVEALRPTVVGRILDDVALHSHLHDPLHLTTRRQILERIGHSQTTGGSGHQKIQGLLIGEMLEIQPAEQNTHPQTPETLRLTQEAAQLIISLYEQEISLKQQVIIALRDQYPHLWTISFIKLNERFTNSFMKLHEKLEPQ